MSPFGTHDLTSCAFLLVARRANYVVDGRFFGHFFWKVEGTVHIHVSHVQLPYTVINVHGNVQDGGGGLNQTSENSEISEIFKLQ